MTQLDTPIRPAAKPELADLASQRGHDDRETLLERSVNIVRLVQVCEHSGEETVTSHVHSLYVGNIASHIATIVGE